MHDWVKKPATYEDLERLPEQVVGELVDGALYASPRPLPRHGVASVELVIELGRYYSRGNDPKWRFIMEPEIHWGKNVVIPDVAGWKVERLTPIPDTVGIRVTPDWLCETLSPSTARLDRTVKLALYARRRVPYVWLVDPATLTVEAFELQGKTWSLQGSWVKDARIRIAPFLDFEIDISLLWPGFPTVHEPQAKWRVRRTPKAAARTRRPPR
jgi:Uma2 family endonuclease